MLLGNLCSRDQRRQCGRRRHRGHEEERKRIGIGEKSEDTDNNQSFLYALSVQKGTDRDLIKKA